MDLGQLSTDEKDVYAALSKVIDPELGVSLVDLGLIYKIKIDAAGTCNIDWTLTTMGCPIVEILQGSIYDAAMKVDAVKKCQVKLVYYPQWTPEMMTREARLVLGIHL